MDNKAEVVKNDYVFVLQDLTSEDDLVDAKVFTKAKSATERLVSLIDGCGLLDAAGDPLEMEDVLAWCADDALEVWDDWGRVIYRLYRVVVEA